MRGNDGQFDPAPLLALDRPLVTWGANHYSHKLPPSPAWIFWDKRENTPPDDGSDGELAWCSPGGPWGGTVRTFRHLWRGLCRASEKNGRTGPGHAGAHLHPTQKPIALCAYVYQRAKLKAGDLVFVPYGGSGPDLPAARAMGLRLIWCEVERQYCDAAIGRLGAITAERAAEPCGPLFEVA
jgi:DNA modification methylase